jgi:hypothetical protein
MGRRAPPPKKKRERKCNESPFIGNEVVSCGRTDGGTAMAKLIVTFRNFANGYKKLKVLNFPLILNFRRSIPILEIPRLRFYPSDNGSIHLKMNIEHYWNDIDGKTF